MTAAILWLAARFGVSKWIIEGALLATVAAALVWGVHTYNQSIRDALVAKQQAAIVATQQRMQDKADAAVSAAVQSERDRAAQNPVTKEIIRRVPVTVGCIGSPAERAMLDRVRATAGGAGAAAGAGAVAGVPARAAGP